MADISDIEETIANALTSILYPYGLSQSSIVGTVCRVYRGWPNSATLNTDLNNKAVNVTVLTDNDSGRTTTRYLSEWQTTVSQPGIVAATANQTISISGSPAAGDVVGALIDKFAYVYRIEPGDTSSLVAANLNKLIRANFFSHLAGAKITISGARLVSVRVVCDNAASVETRRQEKDLRVICWCPSPAIRDLVAGTIDSGLDQLDFLALPDGTQGRMIYRNTASYDQAQNALLYRRDLVNTVEYPTITVVQQPSMLFGASEIDGNITYG